MNSLLHIQLYRCVQEWKFVFFFSVSVCLITFFPVIVSAQGNLLITPGRVIFEGRKKIQEINLANTGNDTARYLISLIEIRMNENGSFAQITKPDSGQYFASSYLRLFPRNVVLGPNEAQSVKIQLIKTNLLVSGEYRSHIYIRSEPDKKPLGENVSRKDTTAISVQLTPVFGISIPVIIRVGEDSTNVRISDLSLTTGEDMQRVMNMVFNRNGTSSVYGDITVEYISAQGKRTQVGLINGLAVYTPNARRSIKMKLNKQTGIDYKTGKIHVTYTTPSGVTSTTMAEAEMILH